MKTKLSLIALSVLFALSARADIIPGLEAYGDLTLVDEVDCATDTTHEFHEYTANASYATNILGSPCRVLEHPEGSAGWMSWTLGKGKGLEAHAMYLLVAEYPEDVPRTGTFQNRAMRSYTGFHTGLSVGNSMSSGVLPQVELESMNVPLSGKWERLEQVMLLNENVINYDDTATIHPVQDGFDAVFSAFKKAHATDSAGIALRSLKLYRMNDEQGFSPAVRSPSSRRYITWRDEMGKHAAYGLNDDRYENARIEARLMKALGINCFSYDILEFGYNQYWDVSYANRGSWFTATADYWSAQVDIFGAAGISLLPYYEYSGSRGPSGLGGNSYRKAVPLMIDENGSSYDNIFNQFVRNNNNPGKCGANVDLTDSAANEDFAAILDCTILRYKDQANFVGAWIRQRGNMPMSFSDNTLARFNADTGRTSAGNPVTRQDIQGGKDYRALYVQQNWPALYKEYRNWWYGKRRDFLVDMQEHLEDGGLADAKVFFSGIACEPGPIGRAGTYYNELFSKVAAQDAASWKALSGQSSNVEGIGPMAGYYQSYFLDRDEWTYFPYEVNHSAPKNDPLTYTNIENVAVAYPYNTIYSTLAKTGPSDVAPRAAQSYRNASGDLFFTRHYCLHEGMGNERSGKKNYFSCDMDYVGRAIVLPELWALAVQDPTVIGFLLGSRLARNSSKEFKDFAEHYTTLPAVPGSVILGGGWGEGDYTIRKYKADGETYYAIVNTSAKSFDNGWKRLSDESVTVTLYDTVTGEQTTLGNQYARFTLDPFQLKVYSTKAPDTPYFKVAVPAIGSTTASVPLAVTTLGGSSASLRVSYSTSPDMSGATVLPVSTLVSAGTNTVTFTSLSPNTTYYATFGITNALGNGAAHVLSFMTDIPSDYPRGTMDVSATSNEATISVNLSSFGDGSNSCDLYAVFTPAEPGLAVRSGLLGSRSTVGACSFPFAPLSSEATYTAELFATNSAGYGIRLAVATVTTLPRPAGFAPEYRPGLMQHKYGCTQSQHPDWSVGAYGQADADRTLGTIMADVTGNPGPEVTNPLSGKTYQWANNTTFVYEGQMWFEGGIAYNFFHNVDDGVAIELDGTMLTDLGNSSGYQTITQVSKTYAESGWHDIRVWVYDWTGNKGYGSKVGGMEYKTGLGWNTNGTTSVTAADVGKWSNLSDPGDGSLLRTRIGYGYVAAAGAPGRSGSSLLVPLRYRSYDEDDALVVYYRPSAIPADPFDPASWQGSAAVSPLSFPGESTVSATVSGHSLQPGDTVWLSARLANARLGHESWSEPVSYTVPADLSDPEFTAALDGAAGFRDAAFAVTVGSIGDGAQNVTVSLAVTGGGTTHNYTIAQNAASYAGTFRTPYELAYGTDYTAVVTVLNNRGKSATQTVSFRTKDRVAPAATLAVGTVGFTDAAFTVDVSSFGTDATSGSVRVEVLDGSTVVWSDTANVSATGAAAFSATGLPDGSALSVRATVTTDAGTVSLGPTAFSTTAFGAPVFGTCEAANVSWDSAMLSAALSALGAGSGSASVSWTLSGGAATPSSGTISFPQAGSQTASVAGLAPETAYTVTLVATGENGKTAETSFSFTTLRLPLVLSEASGVCNGAGTEATAKVTVTRADVAATLALFVDGVVAKTWTGVEAGAEYSFSFPIEVGQTKAFRFVLSADGCTDVEKTGSVTGRQVVDWFNVPLNDAAYANWTLADGPDAYEPSATWTIKDERNTSAITNDGAGGREILLAPRGEGSVAYEPAFPSEANRTLEVSGTAKLRANAGLPPSPEGAPLAGLALGVAGETPALFGWTADGWTALSGTAPAADTSFAWKAVVDFANGTVTYYADGTALAPASGGAAALPLGVADATHAERLVFAGAGSVGPFRGVYADAAGGAIKLWEAKIREGRTGLTFTTVGASEKFVIGLKEAKTGAYYVAFAANSLDTPANDWVCVACSSTPAIGGENVDLPCSTVDDQGNPIPSQFFKIYAAGAPVARGTYWRDCDFVAGE